MARKKQRVRSSKVKANRSKFGAAARTCHRETDSASGFGKCMKSKLSSGRSRKKRR